MGALILVDSNVLIDVISGDPDWHGWSSDQLDGRHDGALAVNQIVLAEVAQRFETLAQFMAEIRALSLQVEEFGCDAAFVAGKAFGGYRRNRGPASPKLPLPDFFIGGHAQFIGATILTRDPRFYRAYFPQVPLITPSKDDA